MGRAAGTCSLNYPDNGSSSRRATGAKKLQSQSRRKGTSPAQLHTGCSSSGCGAIALPLGTAFPCRAWQGAAFSFVVLISPIWAPLLPRNSFQNPKAQIQVVKPNLKANTLPYRGGWFPPSSRLSPCSTVCTAEQIGETPSLSSLFPGPFKVYREGLLPLPIRGRRGRWELVAWGDPSPCPTLHRHVGRFMAALQIRGGMPGLEGLQPQSLQRKTPKAPRFRKQLIRGKCSWKESTLDRCLRCLPRESGKRGAVFCT